MPNNHEQIEYWNGPAGERWVSHQAVLDVALRSFGQALLESLHIRPGERVLDVGCGCGDATLELARRVGEHGFVCGIDVSASMLAQARSHTAGLTNIDFIEADAATHAFYPSFDVICSRFGVMFFEDPIKAFQGLRAALRKGGRLGFVCWQSFRENPWGHVPVDVIRRLLPDAPTVGEEGGPGPYAFAARDYIERILSAADFIETSIAPFTADVMLSKDSVEEAVAFAMSAGPAARLLASAPATMLQTVRDAMTQALSQHKHANGVTLPGSAWIVTARLT
jgi:ubiquinone/menaquinone biosynthesis C-methylase UbiE